MNDLKIGDQVKSGRYIWSVGGFIGKKYLLERRINWHGYNPYTETKRKVRSGWRIKKISIANQ